jgi:undecaprenyl diphosphate synthase
MTSNGNSKQKENQLTAQLQVPYHLAIIMDGNGRWAQSRGLPRLAGHRAGTENLRRTLKSSVEFGVKMLTIYAFSTENWKRPKMEVEFLMKLLERYLRQELPTYLEHNIRFEPVGNLERFSESLRKTINEIRSATAHCDGLVQSLALNYGSRDELVRAASSLSASGAPITEAALDEALDCSCEVDLLIRTGGDHRLSNFMLWQAAYAELFFTETLWPDFTTDELQRIIDAFCRIERRFGGLK